MLSAGDHVFGITWYTIVMLSDGDHEFGITWYTIFMLSGGDLEFGVTWHAIFMIYLVLIMSLGSLDSQHSCYLVVIMSWDHMTRNIHDISGVCWSWVWGHLTHNIHVIWWWAWVGTTWHTIFMLSFYCKALCEGNSGKFSQIERSNCVMS